MSKMIKCPECGTEFSLDDSGMAAIIQQVRNHEFDEEVERRVAAMEETFRARIESAQASAREAVAEEARKSEDSLKEKIAEMTSELNNRDVLLAKLKSDMEAEAAKGMSDLKQQVADRDVEISRLCAEAEGAETKQELALASLKDSYEAKLAMKQEEVDYYKDFKLRQSTKMIGESLERHCEAEFEKLRATAFQNVYFEKDNDARSGSKGDYIYRETDGNGVEVLSIMFEMKNQNDETATKKKNEDFLKELDKDRREKGCEYAILVSMLESDSELYNAGIVDKSHRYEKMYVIRPQFFIPMITILRNTAMNALSYRTELEEIRRQNVDVTNFEENIQKFKEGFARNYSLASKKFMTAIDEIDKTILHLQKTKEALLSSENNLRLASNKTEDLTIRRLTRGNPTMKAMFEDAKKAGEEG